MSLFIGLSALQSSQTGLDIISQNISNASTPGYHRQQVHFESLNDNLFRGRRIGSGVSVNDIERIRFQVIESFLTESVSDVSQVNQQLSIETQLETLFLPGEGSLQQALGALYDNISSLSSAPSDSATRNLVVQSGAQLTSQFRELANQLQSVRDSVFSQIQSEVSTLNNEIIELSNLNEEIVIATATGGPPNGLLDARDQIINSIAEKVNVSRSELDNGALGLTFGNYSILRTITDVEFSVSTTVTGEIDITFGDDQRSLQLSSGRLAALEEAYNELLPDFTQRLDELASSLIQNFDQVHATGMAHEGPFLGSWEPAPSISPQPL